MKNLHSNLVILLSADIEQDTRHYQKFTFQFGYFTIVRGANSKQGQMKIYIPIWLFYYEPIGSFFSGHRKFTFQFGYFTIIFHLR